MPTSIAMERISAMQKLLSVSKVRAQLSKLAEENFGQIVVTKNGKPVAVLLTILEYNALTDMAAHSVNQEDYEKI